jgi:hypothetical protein
MQENIIEPQGEVESVKGTNSNRAIKVVFIVTMAIFVISMLDPTLWYVAAGVSIIFPILFLIMGALTFKKGGFHLMGFAILFFVVAFVVGYGTCIVNIGGGITLEDIPRMFHTFIDSLLLIGE